MFYQVSNRNSVVDASEYMNLCVCVCVCGCTFAERE